MSFITEPRHIKKTRKKHFCVLCERTIPTGKPAASWFQVEGGDAWSPYLCKFCEDLYISGQVDFSEGIDGAIFNDWLHEQEFAQCPKCKAKYGEIEWSWLKDRETTEVFCCNCNHEWIHRIGWGEEEP